MTMADRIVVLQSGRIEQVGPPLDLYDRPANVFVAEFIGSPSMNLIPASVSGSSLRLEEGGSIDLPAGLQVADGKKVLIGKRPEEIVLAADGLTAQVLNIDPTGSESVVDLTLHGRSLTLVLRERPQFRVGDQITIGMENGATHLFDSETGLRIG